MTAIGIFSFLTGMFGTLFIIAIIGFKQSSKQLKYWKEQAKNLSNKIDIDAKRVVDNDISMYRAREGLRIDKEILVKEKANWETINQIRETRREAQESEYNAMNACSRMEGKKEGLAESLKAKDEQIKAFHDMNTELISSIRLIISQKTSVGCN